MDFVTLLIAICMINTALFFIDYIFKTCSHYPYIRFLQITGLNVGPLKVSLFTRVFNKTIQRWSAYKPKFFDAWFNFGVLATVLLIPTSIIILMISIKNLLKPESLKLEDPGIILEPMVPGINLPVTDFSYYLLTIIICTAVHEIGHAIAALREDVQVNGIGFSAFLFVPFAYVKLNTDQLVMIHPRKQLRIYSAGIWNNMALAIAAYSFLILLPTIFSPVYDIGKGVTVLDIQKNSQVGGKTGITVGDKLVAINDCEVSDMESWKQCLKSFNDKPAPGFCVNEDIIHELDQSVPLRMSEREVVECCDEHSQTHLCFETLDDGKPLQIPQYSCLPGRPVIAGTAYMCNNPKDCPPNLQCVRPVTPQGMTLLRIQRSQGNVVIFIGKPNSVLKTVEVTDYGKVFNLFSPRFAHVVMKFAKYITLISSSLALINTVPCFYFDGNHITFAVIRSLCPRTRYSSLYGLLLNIFGTVLLSINFLYIMWASLLSYY